MSNKPADSTLVSIDCLGVTDGRKFDVIYRYRTNVPQDSPWSTAVTVMCADVPDPPAPPTKVIGTRDLMSVEWALPVYDGGSPTLGFFVFMRLTDDIEDLDYTYVTNDDTGEDSTYLQYSTTGMLDHRGVPIQPGDYLFTVVARNWVGNSTMSDALTVTITFLVDPSLTVLTKDLSILGAVTSTVAV